MVVGILGTAPTLRVAYEGIQYDGQISQWMTDRSVRASFTKVRIIRRG